MIWEECSRRRPEITFSYFCCCCWTKLGLPTQFWDNSGDLRMGMVWEGKRAEQKWRAKGSALWSWSSFGDTDLYSLKISCNSGGPPGPTWRSATLSKVSNTLIYLRCPPFSPLRCCSWQIFSPCYCLTNCLYLFILKNVMCGSFSSLHNAILAHESGKCCQQCYLQFFSVINATCIL